MTVMVHTAVPGPRLYERDNWQVSPEVVRCNQVQHGSWGGGVMVFPVDIYETAENYQITAELPGLTKSDIALMLHDNILTIQGEKREGIKTQSISQRRVERCYGTFYRCLILPGSVGNKHIEGDYCDGILTITISKAESAVMAAAEIAQG